MITSTGLLIWLQERSLSVSDEQFSGSLHSSSWGSCFLLPQTKNMLLRLGKPSKFSFVWVRNASRLFSSFLFLSSNRNWTSNIMEHVLVRCISQLGRLCCLNTTVFTGRGVCPFLSFCIVHSFTYSNRLPEHHDMMTDNTVKPLCYICYKPMSKCTWSHDVKVSLFHDKFRCWRSDVTHYYLLRFALIIIRDSWWFK